MFKTPYRVKFDNFVYIISSLLQDGDLMIEISNSFSFQLKLKKKAIVRITKYINIT